MVLHILHLMRVYILLVTLAFAHALMAKFIGSEMISYVGPIILYHVCKMSISTACSAHFLSQQVYRPARGPAHLYTRDRTHLRDCFYRYSHEHLYHYYSSKEIFITRKLYFPPRSLYRKDHLLPHTAVPHKVTTRDSLSLHWRYSCTKKVVLKHIFMSHALADPY